MWISVAFAGTLALGRTFERERHSETLRALMLAPASRPAIYVGKLLGILALLLVVEVILVPLVGLLFQAAFYRALGWMVGLLLTGTIGFAAVGTLFAAMLVRARSRDVMLPVLLYPITIPVIIAGVRGTAALLAAMPERSTGDARLATISGVVPGLYDRPAGCLFAPRCSLAGARCREAYPPYEEKRPGHWVACPYWSEAK